MKNIFFCAILTTLIACTVPVSPASLSATAPATLLPNTTPTSPPTIKPPAALTPTTRVETQTANPAQVCAGLKPQGREALYVIFIEPMPSLVWDPTPRQFRVGICNTLSVSTVEQGKFAAFVLESGTPTILGQTSALTAQLNPGLQTITLGSWTPGLQNHVTACVIRPSVEIQIAYTDFAGSQSFTPLRTPDGKDKIVFPVMCGGNFP